MAIGTLYYAAFGIMLTDHEDWIDLEKIKAFTQEKLQLELTLDSSLDPFDAIEQAFCAHGINDGFFRVLESADTSEQLQGAYGFDRDVYLIYFAKFPWDLPENAFTSESEVSEQILKTIMLFTHDGVTEAEVAEEICFLSEEFS